MEPLDAPAQNRPTDSAGLLRCHGVGEEKLDANGSAFLTAIRGWNANGQCPEQPGAAARGKARRPDGEHRHSACQGIAVTRVVSFAGRGHRHTT
jgi:hypothetical protein